MLAIVTPELSLKYGIFCTVITGWVTNISNSNISERNSKQIGNNLNIMSHISKMHALYVEIRFAFCANTKL